MTDPTTPVVKWNYHPFTLTMTAKQREAALKMLDAPEPRHCDRAHLAPFPTEALPCGSSASISVRTNYPFTQTCNRVTELQTQLVCQWGEHLGVRTALHVCIRGLVARPRRCDEPDPGIRGCNTLNAYREHAGLVPTFCTLG